MVIDKASSVIMLPHFLRGHPALWKQWKNYRTRIRELKKRGISQSVAVPVGCSRKGPWRMSKVKWVAFALPRAYFIYLGLFLPGPPSALSAESPDT